MAWLSLLDRFLSHSRLAVYFLSFAPFFPDIHILLLLLLFWHFGKQLCSVFRLFWYLFACLWTVFFLSHFDLTSIRGCSLSFVVHSVLLCFFFIPSCFVCLHHILPSWVFLASFILVHKSVHYLCNVVNCWERVYSSLLCVTLTHLYIVTLQPFLPTFTVALCIAMHLTSDNAFMTF